MIAHLKRFTELDPRTLYGLLRLRTDVFIVEQQCPYPDLDGRDVEPDTHHLWFAAEADNADPYSYLRILRDQDGTARIGRVCTAEKWRGTGLAGQLLRAALHHLGPDTPCVLAAQSHLTGYYQRFGFTPSGPEFLEDGIPHTPMHRP